MGGFFGRILGREMGGARGLFGGEMKVPVKTTQEDGEVWDLQRFSATGWLALVVAGGSIVERV